MSEGVYRAASRVSRGIPIPPYGKGQVGAGAGFRPVGAKAPATGDAQIPAGVPFVGREAERERIGQTSGDGCRTEPASSPSSRRPEWVNPGWSPRPLGSGYPRTWTSTPENVIVCRREQLSCLDTGSSARSSISTELNTPADQISALERQLDEIDVPWSRAFRFLEP